VASIRMKSHVGSDGKLSLELPMEFRGTDVEVVVEMNPDEARSQSGIRGVSGWPEGFFETTFGSCKDEPLTRLPQGVAEAREALK
jgi:hypothetical protein